MSSSSKTKPFSRGAGDWTCPDKSCGNLNFARRDQCNRCDAAKPNSGGGGGGGGGGSRRRSSSGQRDRGDSSDKKYNAIGNAVAKSSKGLFSPEDWSCMKCGNINWARRSTCNICNAKKFSDEERTGYGGGYNERANVEYKDPVSSDSEYDEFGRRKKKKSDSRKTVSSSKSSRDNRRSRSRSRSSRSSSSSSSSDRDHRRKRSRRSPSPKRSRRRRRSSSSSSSDSSRGARDRDTKRTNKDKEDRSRREPAPKEKSPQPPPKHREEDDDDEEESGSDADLSKYDLFDDDFDIETFKKDSNKDSS